MTRDTCRRSGCEEAPRGLTASEDLHAAKFCSDDCARRHDAVQGLGRVGTPPVMN